MRARASATSSRTVRLACWPCDNAGLADAIAKAVAAVSKQLAVLAISGTELQAAASRAGLQVFSEIFADPPICQPGRLVPRSQRGAMIDDVVATARRLLVFLESGRMPTLSGTNIALHAICVHGDSTGAVQMARVIRERLTAAGIGIKPFLELPGTDARHTRTQNKQKSATLVLANGSSL